MADNIKLKENFKKFGKNTTINGFINASVSKTIEVRIAWIFVILISFGLGFYIIYCNYVNYLTYQSKTTIREINEAKSKFPTVVICNRNMFTNEFSFEFLNNYSSSANQSFKNDKDFLYKAYSSYLKNIKHEKEIGLIHYEIEDILLTCEFNQEDCDGSFFESFSHNTYGSCFMFNSNSSFDSYGPGKERGLTMELFSGVYDQLDDKYADSKGLAIIVLNNTSMNGKNMDGLFVSPEQETNIVVKRNFNHRLPKPYSNCDIKEIKPDSFNSDFYKILINKTGTYKYEDCMELCYQYFVVKECKCFDHESFWFFDNVQVCHTDHQIDCVEKIDQNISTSTNLNEICYPWCPVECDLVFFSTTISTSSYPPNDYYLDELRKDDKIVSKFFNISSITNKRLRQNVLQISIYYDSLSYLDVSQSPTMTPVDLMANLGGVLGLFLGF